MNTTLSPSLRKLRATTITLFLTVVAWTAIGAQYVVQPGPADSQDIFTTSVYSFAPGGSYPGGGENGYRLRVGGWADFYYSLLQFDLTGLPPNASSAVLYLYCFYDSGSATPMYLDRITQAWDWRTSGTGRDRERLWWADRPAATQWIPNTIPATRPEQWYAVDITGLYNGWQSGLYPNYGLQLRPQQNGNNYNAFYSADYADNPALRPKLVITAPAPVAPGINAPPQSQAVHAGVNVNFGVTATGTPPLSYQWRKDRVNISGATGATLTLNSVGASDSGGYSVVVRNAYGSVVSATALLAVLADGANGSQLTQLSEPPAPAMEPSQDSMVLVTHGWHSREWYLEGPPTSRPQWMTDLCAALQSKVPANWVIWPYDWMDTAWKWTPDEALSDARYIVGPRLGARLAAMKLSQLHLISHSAGAGLIEAAAKTVRALSPGTVIHCTFLDPFTGKYLEGRSYYGQSAHWADNYFVQDFKTDIFPTIFIRWPGATSGPLDYAYNVDVGGAVQAANRIEVYFSGGIAGSTPPVVNANTAPSHDSPREFYLSTVNGTAPACAVGFGFAFSQEANGWSGLPWRGDRPFPLCGGISPVQNPMPVNINSKLLLESLPNGTSPSGVILFTGGGASLTTTPPQPAPQRLTTLGGIYPSDNGPSSAGTPVWLAVGLTITNAVNFVQFDAGFTDTNAAQGLLTVYWNTNQIGMMDERTASPGLQTYSFSLPGTITEGIYTLSFRLDSFSPAASSITVTNVAMGFVGLTQPITLAMLLPASNTPPVLQLTAPASYNYLIQSSTNLTNWTPAALLVNTNGTVLFADPAATNFSRRFYRATMP